MTEAVNLVGGQKSAITESYADKGYFPANNSAAGVAEPASITGSYVSTVTIWGTSNSATITAQMKGSSVAKDIQSAKLQLYTTAPSVAGGAFVWTCGTSASYKFVPATCRNKLSGAT